MEKSKTKKEDLRIRRTHKLLREALFALLETKSFDEISVVDICDKAMVHRATFYKHFKDKYEFMEYAAKERIRELYYSNIEHGHFTDVNDMYRSLIPTVLTFIEDNKKVLLVSASSTETGSFVSLQKIIADELIGLLDDALNSKEVSVPLEVVANFLAGGFIALARWWIVNDNEYSKEAMSEYIEKMLLNSQTDL